jgi:TP901 family phage tail tape measure protein
MAVSIAELQAMIGADLAGLDKGIKEAQKKLETLGQGVPAKGIDSFVDRARKSLEGFGDQATRVGTAISVGLALPLTLIGKKIFDVGSQYEKAMNLFQVVTTATVAEMSRAAQVAEALGNDLKLPGVSAADAATAMTELGKAGFTATQSLEGARGVLELATAATIGAGAAATITANALQAFGLAASESGRVADLLAASANATSAEITDVAMALQQSSASAAALKIPIDDLVTAIGEMANNAIKGSDAGTSLKTFMAALTPTTKQAAAAMHALGIDAFDSTGHFVGLRTVIEQAAPALARMSDEQKNLAIKIAFGSDAMRAANIILGQGVEKYDALHAATTKAGAAQELAAANSKGLSGAMDALISTLETVGITIYKAVGPGLESMIRSFGDLANKLSSVNPEVIKAGATFVSVFATGGVAALAIGKTITALAALSVAGGVITLAITAVGLLAAAYVTDFGSMNTTINNHFALFRQLLGENQKAATSWGEEWSRVGIGFDVMLDSILITLEVTASEVVRLGSVMFSALKLDWDGVVAAWNEGEARLDAISATALKNFQAREHARAQLDFAAWSRHYDERAAQAAAAGSKIAIAENDGFLKAYQNPADAVQKALAEGKGPAIVAAKKFGLDVGHAITQGTLGEFFHSPFFIVHEFMNQLGPSTQAAASYAQVGSKAGASIVLGFGQHKGKVKALAKAMLDEALDGVAGLEDSLASLSARAAKGGFEFLFNKMGKATKELADKTKTDLKVAADAINEFFQALGSNAKINITQLASDFGKFAAVSEKALEFKRLKEAIGDLNLDRAVKGLLTFDDSLKLNGKTIEISISTFKALQAAFPGIIDSVQKAGFEFKQTFPVMEHFLDELADKAAESVTSVKLSFLGLANGFPVITAKVHKPILDLIAVSDDFIKKQAEMADKVAATAPHWAGAIVDAAARVKDALQNQSSELLRVRAALDIRSSIDSAIGDFERYGQQLGKSGRALEVFVEEQTRKELSKFKDITQEELNAAIEAHKKAAIRLPGIWEEVFSKMSSRVKGWAGDVIGIIEVLPSKFGDVGRKILSTADSWLTFANKVLGIIHRLNSDVPASLGDMLSKVIGIFKGAGSGSGSGSGSIFDGLFGVIKNLFGGPGGYTEIVKGSAEKVTAAFDDLGFSAAKNFGGAASSAKSAASSLSGSASSMIGSAAGIATAITGLAALFVSTFGSKSAIVRGVGGGASFGLLGALTSIFFGGPSKEEKELAKAQMAAQLAQAKATVALVGEQVKQAIEDTKQKLLTTVSQARDILESIRFWDSIGKLAIKGFFKDLNRFFTALAEEAKNWKAFADASIKTTAENLGAGVDLIGKLLPVLQGIGTHFHIGEGQIAILFSDAQSFFSKLGDLADAFGTHIEKQIKKFGERVGPGVQLFAPLIEALKSMADLKDVPDTAFDIIQNALSRIVDRIGNLTDSFAKSFIKAVAFFSENISPGVDLWKNAIDTIKSMVDIPTPTEQDFANLFASIKSAISGMVTLAGELSTDGLAKAQAIATASLAIFAAIKAAVEALGGLRDYKAIASETFAALLGDFDKALGMLNLMSSGADLFQSITKTIADKIAAGGDYLKTALLNFASAITAAASAINGALNLQSGALSGGLGSLSFTSAGAGSLGSFSSSSFAPSSFASPLSPSFAGGSAGFSTNNPPVIEMHFHAPVNGRADFEKQVLGAWETMSKSGIVPSVSKIVTK